MEIAFFKIGGALLGVVLFAILFLELNQWRRKKQDKL